MLNPLPDLLIFSFFAPTILRVAAACIFFSLAVAHIKRRDEIAVLPFPIVSGTWIAYAAAGIELVVGFALFFGAYTQVAAMLGLLGAFKHFVWRRTYPAFFVLSRSTSVLLMAILFSLLITGAGAFAVDLPL